MSAAASASAVTKDDVTQFANMDLELFKNNLADDFKDHKFVKANAGLTICHSIMTEFINARLTSTQPGANPTATNDDLFTRVRVLV